MQPIGLLSLLFSIVQLMCTLHAAPTTITGTSLKEKAPQHTHLVEISKMQRVVDAIGLLQALPTFDEIGKIVSKMVTFSVEQDMEAEQKKNAAPERKGTILDYLERINRTLPQHTYDVKSRLANTIELVAGLTVAETQRFRRLPTMLLRYLQFQTDKIEKSTNNAKQLEYTSATIALVEAYVSVLRDPAFLDRMVEKGRSLGANAPIGSSDELLKLLQDEGIEDVPSVTLVLHLLFLFSATGILTPVVCFGSSFFKGGTSVCEAFVSSITWQEFTVIVEMVRRLRQA